MKLVTFRIHNELYALPIDSVRSIERIHPIRPVPHAPETIIGIMNLRGVVITVADLRTLLHMPAQEFSADTRLLIVANTAYVVDEALDVLDVEDDAIEASEDGRDEILGVLQIDGKLVVVLQDDALAIA